MGPNSPAVLPLIRDLPQFSVIPLERRAGVFDVVDVVDAVAIVTHLPDGEGFCFLGETESDTSTFDVQAQSERVAQDA